jgi:hypothetical protein
MRSLLMTPLTLVLLLSGCPSDPGYSLVCEDVLGDGSRAHVACDHLVRAVVAEMDSDDEITEAAVRAFVGCAPGAFCGLRADIRPGQAPVSALIGVRTASGEASVWGVGDVAARPLSPAITLGYDPDEFIEGLASSVAASRAP